MADILYIVVPCYNEEEVLPETSRRLRAKLEGLMAAGKISERSRVLFVNDGSRDRTWELITRLHGECPLFCGADLSRNRGHQNALLAGLMTAKERCDMAISMDADLQDDIDAVDAMVEQYYAGCDVVYGVRSSRKKDTFFKRFTAEGFYRVMNFMGAETVFNHADYRLMSRRALEGLAQFREVNLFLRGIVPMIGYRTSTVEYERGERFAGESKYPLKKMLSFAMEGITSLSVKPIRYITGLGFLIFAVSILMLIYSIVRWATGATIIGWASVICSVWAIGGLILLSLGVIGGYIGKIYLETKGRPASCSARYWRMRMAKKLIDKSIPRFLLVGVGNTLLSMVLMFLLEGLGYWPSTAIAYVAGAVMSFFLNRHFTFHSEETLGRSAVKFAVNVAVCYVVGYGLARLIVGGPPPLTAVPAVWWERFSKLVGMGLYTALNYFGQRFFAFRKKNS